MIAIVPRFLQHKRMQPLLQLVSSESTTELLRTMAFVAVSVRALYFSNGPKPLSFFLQNKTNTNTYNLVSLPHRCSA